MKKLMYFSLVLICGLLPLSGCTAKVARCSAPEDNSPHHYLMGMKSLEEGKVPAAREKFERALYCSDEFSVAYGGLAIVVAEELKVQSDPGFRNMETERVGENLKKARKFADKPEEMFDYYAAGIRTHTLMKGKEWLDEAQDAYRDGSKLKVQEQDLIYYQGSEALAYFMGIAYLEAQEFPKARDSFAAVLNAKQEGKWHGKADRAWKKTDRIVRALAGITVGDVGRKIAVKDTVTRADLAALLIDEMKIDKLMAGRIPLATQQTQQVEFTPADVVDHPFREEVLTLLKWKVRGMEPKHDETTKAYLFKPADKVSRGELAFILEDVLIKLTGDEKLATAYFGQDKSPFPDVRTTSPFYNAVMNMTTRNIMEGELSGEFRLGDPVDGAEALLAMRMLRQKINIY